MKHPAVVPCVKLPVILAWFCHALEGTWNHPPPQVQGLLSDPYLHFRPQWLSQNLSQKEVNMFI